MGARLSILGIVALLTLCASELAAWTGARSPHDTAHLVVIRPGDFRAADTKPAESAIQVDERLTALVKIRHAGEYRLWVRVRANLPKPSPIEVTLLGGAKELLRSAANDGPGSVAGGGLAGYENYAKLARATGVSGSSEQASTVDPDKAHDKASELAGEIQDDLAAELDAEAGKAPQENWIHDARLEELADDGPFYWWQIGKIKLESGEYQLQLAPRGQVNAKSAAEVDAAFLSTSTEFVYPFAGDLDAPPAGYVRFRIDELPPSGVTIGTSLRLHYEPWGTPHVWFNPAKVTYEKSEPHVAAGYTRWYRLQDIRYAPAFGEVEAQLTLDFGDAKSTKSLRGATQFAVFPHADSVLREIDWHEPEGLRISFVTDFEKHLHRLRTLRDFAREHYDFAVRATQGTLYPLTRGELYFGNAWGGADGECVDYMAKTLRLLGFNCVGQSHEPVAYRKLYGWSSHAAVYSPDAASLPFDEEQVRKNLADFDRDYFSKNKELFEDVPIFQLADEPSEIDREAMSAPLWVYSKTADGQRYTDPAGNSDLNSRRADLANCVLEGKISQLGRSIGFRVGLDDPQQPTRYAVWQVGSVSVDRTTNLKAAKIGIASKEGEGLSSRPGASLSETPTDFKIVYEGTSAALYLGNRLIHQHVDLPAQGGLGFTGGPKAISELRLRPIGKDEHIADATELAIGEKKTEDVIEDIDTNELLDELTDDTPDWAKPKPLERAVQEDWIAAGGMPQAHEAFRRWAKGQGVEPSLFGKKSWDDVRMMTIRSLATTPETARLFYFSRKFSGYLTPRMFAMAADSIRKHAPNSNMKSFVALSGHSLYFPSELPLDMFRLASESPAMMPGISDWMSLGSWRWDSHQAVAFSVAPYNAGARRYGQPPISHPMMHCVWPSDLRAYTMLANRVRYVSFYNFGPSYNVTADYWSDDAGAYENVHNTTNRAAQVDDILASAEPRPSRVAMLYSMASEYWNPQASFADKRASFLALAHEYYQPELVTEEQIEADALKHYDALYVLEPQVSAATQQKIAHWTKNGGLLWTCADALTKNEFNEPLDLLASAVHVERTFEPGEPESAGAEQPLTLLPIKGETDFRPHAVAASGRVGKLVADKKARVRARYGNKQPAWIETPLGKGKVIYLGHRAGLTYSSHKVIVGGHHTVWADTGRASLTQPLHEAKIDRELTLSEPLVMATPMSNDVGTVVLLYNMQPAPVTKLQIELKEPKVPHSVQFFDGHKLHDVAFEYKDDRIRVKLAQLEGSQMIVVRRKPPAPDDRLNKMGEQAEQQLQSDDWRALSAGAWFAGHLGKKELTGKLVPLLKHEHWEVRRSAAESLGKIGNAAVGPAILTAMDSETDTHVLAEELVAVAELQLPQAIELFTKHIEHGDAYVRQQALRGAASLLSDHLSKKASGGNASAVARQLAETGLVDPDIRVRGEAIQLLALCDPKELANQAVVAFSSAAITRTEQDSYLEALAGSDAAFQHWLAAKLLGGDAMLLGLAARRADSALAKALQARWQKLTEDQLPTFIAATIRQRDPALARDLFAQREKLPANFQPYVPLVLEYTFNARLGNVIADWQAWLKK